MVIEELVKHHSELCDMGRKILESKSHDYAKDKDAFSNFKQASLLGICSVEQGILVRMCDKLSRLSQIIEKKDIQVKDEKLEDTIVDLINYAAILSAYVNDQKSPKEDA